jgi:hypothetical protein
MQAPSEQRTLIPWRDWPTPETKAVIDDLVEVSLKLALENIEDARFTYHPSIMWLVEEQEMEAHEDRVDRIKFYFFQRDTGEPF